MATHRFQPDHYFNTMGAHPPVLTIAPGDTVITTTVDARGVNGANEKVTTGPNPQTGPFFAAGAEPGVTLVVHIEKLTPNRDTGWSSAILAENVVDPEFVRELPSPPILTWRIDHEKRTASPDITIPGLEHLVLP